MKRNEINHHYSHYLCNIGHDHMDWQRQEEVTTGGEDISFPPLLWYFRVREVESMADKRVINEQYAYIGQRLIDTEAILQDIKESQATIVYLSSQHKKIENGKIVHAQCEKIQEKYKWGLPADFTITVFEPNCIGMTQEQLEILIFHELLHVKIDYKDGEEQYSINPHDLEDFRYIIDRFGSHWDEVKDPHEMDFSKMELESVNMDDQIRQNLDHLDKG